MNFFKKFLGGVLLFIIPFAVFRLFVAVDSYYDGQPVGLIIILGILIASLLFFLLFSVVAFFVYRKKDIYKAQKFLKIFKKLMLVLAGCVSLICFGLYQEATSSLTTGI
jgi:hypothetical protein